ncbi:MAG TPA: alpha-amylase family glycosyl hydrolase [Candidatus Didemnitutus sp.]|nr:alpha-amylase family glycosyl hydrolase [Candidatus Didemnitutus sp.]
MRPVLPRLLGLLVGLLAVSVRADQAAPAVPRFTHPGTGQVFYFLLTDRFANGSTANDTGGIADGPDVSGFDPTRISHYHGGDFAGLIAKLDYIKSLGATAVWVTPPFKNKPMQKGTAGYHGYWILDFLSVDPHLGTDAEFREFVRQAHARGLKVYLDIIVNHTADVIQYRGGKTDYVSKKVAPNRDASGQPFDAHAVAFNGLNSATAFPTLSAERSFAYVPFVPAAEAHAKNPAWLNDVTLYHNRGNSTFEGESSLDGDFVGLDDTFTENPAVVRGFIDIYRHWIEAYGVDGYRIDTTRHVNLEFWQAFAPAIADCARHAGRPDFIQFGEVANDAQDVPLLSEFSTTAPLDATLDFGFFRGTLAYVSQGKSSADYAALFAKDDYYTDHDSNVHTTTTFLGNHDAGRFAYFLQKDNPDASREQLAALAKLGHALLFLVRGQPVIYYGDEQGMIGKGGWDMQAREDMFPAQAPDFKSATLLGTKRTGADDKFDPSHPFYRFISSLASLRHNSAALSTGAMVARPLENPHLFAFSRIERAERVEYLAVFNNSRDTAFTAQVQTSQPGGAKLSRLTLPGDTVAASADAALTTDAQGRVAVTVPPLGFALWRATDPLPVPAQGPQVALISPAPGTVLDFPPREYDGHTFSTRREIRADVTGGDGLAEVTFTLMRTSRPGQYELLGTDDAAPYRIFWQPPPDLAPGEEFSLAATVDDLRGHRATSRVDGLKVAAGTPAYGIKGATVPVISTQPAARVNVTADAPLMLTAGAMGTGPLVYRWYRDGVEVAGGDSATLNLPHARVASSGRYRVLVRGLAGSVLSAESEVTVTPASAAR